MGLNELEAPSTLLPMDGRCFRETAGMMVGKQADRFNDAIIAATARLHGLEVATRNEKGFRHLSVGVINPFKAN